MNTATYLELTMPYAISSFDDSTPLLVHPASSDFALLEYDDRSVPDGTHKVSAKTAELLECGKYYPPALALTKYELQRLTFSSPDELEILVSKRLNHWLAQQALVPFPLWKAAIDDGCDFVEGSYYWVVGLDTSIQYGELVYWVAGEYEVYPGLLTNFCEPDKLRALLQSRQIGVPRRMSS